MEITARGSGREGKHAGNPGAPPRRTGARWEHIIPQDSK